MPPENALEDWRSIVGTITDGIDGVTEDELDRRVDGSPFSIREFVHHITEANVVAASIVVAALGSPGCTFDWSWMMPFGPWMDRLAYRDKPLAASLALLSALNEWVVALVEPLADGLEREVHLRDEPNGALRRVTVADVLRQEADHAREHRRQIDRIRGLG